MTTPPAKRAPKPKRPANLPHGRWLGDLEAERPLSDFERALVTACARGDQCTPKDWDGERPEKGTNSNTIRADLVRFLVLDGDCEHPTHETGIWLGGAWIVGRLNLYQATTAIRLCIDRSHFTEAPCFLAAALPGLALPGCTMPGLEADYVVVKGSVHLDEHFIATDEVRLCGAEIGGDLTCRTGSFHNAGGVALNGDRLIVKGDVFFDSDFAATGEIRLLGARIGGNLECSGGRFLNAGLRALNADGMVVTDGLFLRDASIGGIIDLTAAKVGSLVDDGLSWGSRGHFLDGFHYDRILGPTEASMRIGWLQSQQRDELGKNFAPQPWEHLIATLRNMGHPAEAAEVAIAKQKALRRAKKIGVRHANPDFTGWRLKVDELWVAAANWTTRIWHRIYGLLAGYGHRPADILAWMLALCMVNAVFYYEGRHDGLFGPTNPIIQTQPALAACGDGGTPGRVYWTSTDCPMPPEYTTFQPFLYSLDLILPLVDLGQDSDWAPIVTNERGETLWAGRALRWLMWFEILFGWMASLMLVAIVGRLVDKD